MDAASESELTESDDRQKEKNSEDSQVPNGVVFMNLSFKKV